MDDAMLLPASDSSLAWVYEGATPAMTPDDAATAIRAATIGWTRDDHLQMGALQHHLAVALCDDPDRQAVCSAAAFMHVAAAGMDPGLLLGKSLDPKVLRPKLGAKPERIGTTRSGKPIYNMFTHPAHASFKTADHVDHIKAMEAHNKGKKMNKAGATPSIIGKTRSNKAIHGPSANGIKNFSADHASHSGDDHVDAWKAHVKQASGISGPANQFHIKMANRHSEAALAAGKSKSSFRVPKHLDWQKSGSMAKSGEGSRQRQETFMHKSEAVSILENFLAKSQAKTYNFVSHTHSSYAPVHAAARERTGGGLNPANKKLGEATMAAFPHFTAADHGKAQNRHANKTGGGRETGAGAASLGHHYARRIMNGDFGKSLSKASGEGSRGGKVIGHTKSSKPIYASAMPGSNQYQHLSPHEHIEAADAHYQAAEADKHTGSSAQKHIALYNAHHAHAGKMIHGRAHKFVDHNMQGSTEHLNDKEFSAEMGRRQNRFARQRGADGKKSMSKSDIMGFPVDLGDIQGSPIDGSYVDSMGGSHDMFMQQAELANCPTMWAPIAAVSDLSSPNQ